MCEAVENLTESPPKSLEICLTRDRSRDGGKGYAAGCFIMMLREDSSHKPTADFHGGEDGSFEKSKIDGL
jgi:hypothetical protein